VDRINEEVAHLYDPFNPAVVHMLKQIVDVSRKKGVKVTVCGEMTSDPKAVPLLVGLGVDILSVTPRMYLRIKQIVRSLKMEEMKSAVNKAVKLADSDSIKELFGES